MSGRTAGVFGRLRRGAVLGAASCSIGLGVIAAAGAALLPGCATTPPAPIDVPDEITADDWRVFADDLVVRLEQNGILDRYRDRNGRRPVIAIGNFENNTRNLSLTRTKNFLYNELQRAMVNSGRATINRDVAGTGGTREALLGDIAALRGSPEYDPGTFTGGTAVIPDLILFGDVNADEISAGRTTQFDYQVRVELIDTETRDARWIETINLTKLWRRAKVG